MSANQVTLPDGCRIAYDEYDFVKPWVDADPVILYHGFSKHRKFWFPWIPHLSPHFHLYLPDVRGHGGSDVPDPDDFEMSLDVFARDIDQFAEELGIDEAHFVLAENSTTVGVQFAIDYPERIKTMTLVGFSANYTAADLDWNHWVQLCEEEGAEAWARETNKYRLPEDADPELREWYVTEQGKMPDWLLAGVFRWAQTLDLRDRLDRVEVPTLILSGEKGEQVPIESIHEAVDLMPRSELFVLEDAPFNVMNARPEECAQKTREYLQRHS